MSTGTPSEQSSVSTEDSTLRATLRGVAVVALLGAGAIHFAYAPDHFDDATSHGLFFVAVAWAQIGVVAALLRWRDRREPWLAAAAVSIGVMGVWLVSRTAGVPGESAEDLGWADGLATGLQLVTLLVAVAALLPKVASRPAPTLNPAVGAVAAIALLGGVSIVLNPAVGHDDDHAHGDDHSEDGDDHDADDGHHADDGDHEHGDAEATAASQLVAREDRCDLGFNSATFNETAPQAEPQAHDDDGEHAADFTVEEWAEVFVQPDNPMTDGVTPEEAVAFIESDPQLADGVLSGGVGHSLEPDPWLPMTDHEECEQLGDELELARDVVAAHPTAQHAIDAGYRMVTPYLPAIASHYINTSYVGEFDIEKPAMLLYDGNGPDAGIVGISHYIISDEEPTDGFSSPNFHWHRHLGLCISTETGLVTGGTNLTDAECAERGGAKNPGGNQWMSHTWVVPGCESDWGMFSGANPSIPAREPEAADSLDAENHQDPVPTGCGSGLSPDDDLDLDDGGHGPSL